MWGNRIESFIGDIAPDAKAYVIRTANARMLDLTNDPNLNKIRMEEVRIEHRGNELKVLEEAVSKSSIINRSRAPGSKMFSNNEVDELYIQEMRIILERYNSILLISASNEYGTINENCNETPHLSKMMQNSELSKRVLIIGNLRSLILIQIRKEKKALEDWLNKVMPCLRTFQLSGDTNTQANDEVEQIKKIEKDLTNHWTMSFIDAGSVQEAFKKYPFRVIAYQLIQGKKLDEIINSY